MKIDTGVIGNAIKQARIEKGYTQEQLAALVDVSTMHLKYVEYEQRKPSIELLYRLVKTLNFSVDDLFFPDNSDDIELRRKIERRLRECGPYELNVVNKTIEALLEKYDEPYCYERLHQKSIV